MSNGSFVKGVMTGAVIGAGMAMMVNPMDNRDVKKLQKNTSRFFSAVGGVIDNVLDVLQ